MSKKILVLGKSTLASTLKDTYPEYEIEILGKPEYDFSTKTSCDKILANFNHDVIILTYAINKSDDIFTMIQTNITGVAYIITELYKKITKGQIIFVSSANVNWVSYPNIPEQRMLYGWTKECISKMCEHMNRKNADNLKNISIQVYEPNSFKSKMNPNGKISIQIVLNELKHIIDNPRVSVLRGMNRNV